MNEPDESMLDTSNRHLTRDMIGYGPVPPKVQWPNDAKLALNFVLNYEEGSEYSYASGDLENEHLGEDASGSVAGGRDLGMESIYEFGSRAGVWRILRLFDEYGIKLTVSASAQAVERNRAVGEWLRRSGHDVMAHGWRWEEPWRLTANDERLHIKWAVDSLAQTCGERPPGWFCRYGPSINTRRLLVEEGGFLYDSDSHNDDLPYFVTVADRPHLVIPYGSLPYNDVRFVVAQGYGSPGDWVESCTRAVDEYVREGRAGFPKMMTIGFHPRWAGQAGRTSALREIIEYALGLGDVWVGRRIDIARWWLDHHSEFVGTRR